MAIPLSAAFGRFRSASRYRVRGKAVATAAGVALLGGLVPQNAVSRDFTTGSITVAQPWSRATPGGSKVATGYLVIRNAGDTPDRLTAASTEVSGKVSPHTMTMKDGVAMMRPITEGVVIPAHGAVAFKPGSDHLMMEGLKRPLKKGESFPGTLTFEKAGTVPVTFDVEDVGAQGASGGGGTSASTPKD